jgi:hypothetical protein
VLLELCSTAVGSPRSEGAEDEHDEQAITKTRIGAAFMCR